MPMTDANGAPPRVMEPGELLPDFVDRFQTALDKSGREENAARDLFIDNLRNTVLKLSGFGIKEWDNIGFANVGSNYRDFGRDDRRDRGNDRGRYWGGSDGGRDQQGDGRKERSMERGSTSQWGQREVPLRFTRVCYECGEPGHYRNHCPKLGRDGGPRYNGQRGRSLSPKPQARQQEPRAASEDPVVKRQIEELAVTITSMKEALDAEKAAKEEKIKRKTEKLERKKREEEEAKAAEEK
ncbi:hypothetical protein CBR_g4796 [Chara braunii]|uniref:CCHC-type domain-containing protein n=1 Tax=Chara braunii TaxID=69332 RepID=A0A388KIY3_CHABU|nr:hypothetical protein CBR_g4796 [Chara braunii]|eukprot:GBG69968.1 hypothetical protein CBR_g4796 [Chara braunii]